MNTKTPKCNFYRQELYNSTMQNEAIWYFSAKVSSLKISEKLQFANSVSAAYNQAVMRDKHGKVNGQLPVQIIDFIFNIQPKSPYSLNSKLNLWLFCPILTCGFIICATVGITGVEVRTDPQWASACLREVQHGRTSVIFLLHITVRTAQALLLNSSLGTYLEPHSSTGVHFTRDFS